MAERLLEVKDLHVQFNTEDGVVRAVDGVSFELERGKVLGIVGESGSGKSVTAMTLMGLTRDVNTRFQGEVLYKGRDLLKLPETAMQDFRGNEMGMIFQDPMTSLNPVYRIGDQIVEAIRTHEDVDKRAAKRRAVDLLRQVGIPRPEVRVDDFPHEIIVMYAGRVVERGAKRQVFYDPQMPYTWGLLGSIPRFDRLKPKRLASITGAPPSLINLPRGCKFRPRCPHALSKCTDEPDLVNRVEEPGHLDRCWLSVQEKRAVRDRTIQGEEEAA